MATIRLRLSPIFQDHAVLQRAIPLPIWGTGLPGETVTVRLGSTNGRTVVGPDGSWLLRLPAMSAGGPYELIAESTTERIVFRDILIGEVWLCSGQSNMQWSLRQTHQVEEPRTAQNGEQIRLFSVTNNAGYGRHQDPVGTWKVGTYEALQGFSAVGGWFGDALQAALDVPVGLICNARASTRLQAWMSREALMQESETAAEYRDFEALLYSPEVLDAIPPRKSISGSRRVLPENEENQGVERGWEKPEFDDKDWAQMPLPASWQNVGHQENGIFWFRKTVTIPATWQEQGLTLSLGAVARQDEAWINGVLVGSTSEETDPEGWRRCRHYPIPAQLVGRDGNLCIAVRVRSEIHPGGIIGPEEELRIFPHDDDGLSLAGNWRYAVERDWGVVWRHVALSATTPNSPSILFDSRVAPLIPYGIRGVIWYQGESNSAEPEVYRKLLPLWMRDWRRAWGQGDFAILQVQLANYMMPAKEPTWSNWAELRDAQLAALSEPNSGMAVAIDVGEERCIHPQDKKTVGSRLAAWALTSIYDKPGWRSGPLYRGKEFTADGKVRIFFSDATGLRTRNGTTPAQVAIAGKDRKFVWAESQIEGETLLAWSPQVKEPSAVRYAWANNPAGCNLENAAALPASPFRTDDWSEFEGVLHTSSAS